MYAFYVNVENPDGGDLSILVAAGSVHKAGQLVVDDWAMMEVTPDPDSVIYASKVPLILNTKGVIEWTTTPVEDCVVTMPDLSEDAE